MHAAIVKLNTLANTIGAAAENYDFLFVRDANFVIDNGCSLALVDVDRRTLVGGIVIGRIGLEFSGAGIDELVGCFDTQFAASLANVILGGFIDVS